MNIRWHVKHNPRMHEWRVYDENWYFVAGYETHAEAFAYADRQARTVTLELPAIHDKHEIENGKTLLRVSSVGGATCLSADGDSFVLNPDELKPLGECLLAFHYHYKRNKNEQY